MLTAMWKAIAGKKTETKSNKKQEYSNVEPGKIETSKTKEPIKKPIKEPVEEAPVVRTTINKYKNYPYNALFNFLLFCWAASGVIGTLICLIYAITYQSIHLCAAAFLFAMGTVAAFMIYYKNIWGVWIIALGNIAGYLYTATMTEEDGIATFSKVLGTFLILFAILQLSKNGISAWRLLNLAHGEDDNKEPNEKQIKESVKEPTKEPVRKAPTTRTTTNKSQTPDYYAILSVHPKATQEEITEAFEKKIKKDHPYVNKKTSEKDIQLIYAAYDVLSNDENRKMYDSYISTLRKIQKNKNRLPERKAGLREKQRSSLSVWLAFIFMITAAIGAYYITYTKSDFMDNVNENNSGSITERRTPTTDSSKPRKSELDLSKLRTNEKTSAPIDPEIAAIVDEVWGNEDNGADTTLKYKDNRLNNGDKPYASFYGKGNYSKGSLSQITIKNGTDQDAVVFFQDVNTKKIVRNVYVRAKSDFVSTEIPQGIYEMKVSYGNGWNPLKNNGENNPIGGFVLNISYSKAVSSEDYFDMRREETYSGYNYPTYEVTLHKVVNGNMQTKNISQDDFFN
jgi:curved DNA-binding protein CbpA